ncbi:MAG: transposase, partial [Blautia sp.]|nr:transposase [Blautia sp.]
GLSMQEILDYYTRRWPIEVFFRQSKTKLALDKYQIRTQTGIERYWLIMSLVHYMCCAYNGTYCSFEEGYQYFQRKIREEQVTSLYQSIHNGMTLEDVLKLIG